MSDKPPSFTEPLSPAGQTALDAVQSKRGYTLPYHRLFAAHSPELLTRYDAFYESLTLVPRDLSPYERETVWASLLAAAREVHGFIHMQRARDAGLNDEDLARCVSIAAVTDGFSVMQFSATHWAAWTDPADLMAIYQHQFDATTTGLPPGLAHLAATACMAARREATGMVLHLGQALSAGITRAQACETLSYLLLPCGGNVLIDAVAAWEQAAVDGVVAPPY